MLRFLFRFLRINFGGGTLYYDLYYDIRVSVNSLRLMAELREKAIRTIIFNRINLNEKDD